MRSAKISMNELVENEDVKGQLLMFRNGRVHELCQFPHRYNQNLAFLILNAF